MSHIVHSRQPPVYQNSVTVAKSGGQFNTIQAAINSITDASATNVYAVLIYPGEYEENIVGKDYVNLISMGTIASAVVKGSTGPLYTAPSTSSVIWGLEFKLTPTTTDQKIFEASSGGNHLNSFVRATITSSTNGIVGRIVDASSNSFVVFTFSEFIYTMTGSSAGANTHSIVNYADSSTLFIDSINFTASINDIDDDIDMVTFDSTGLNFITTLRASLTHTNASYSGTTCMFKFTKTPTRHSEKNGDIAITGNGSGIGTIYCIDSTTNDAVINASNNIAKVTNFTNNYFANVATGDTLNSNAELITTADNTTGAGLVNFINSSEHGQLQITSGTEFTIDTTNEWHAFSTLTTGISSSHVDPTAGSTAAITAFADAGGGQVTVTSAGHNLDENEYISITGTTNYNDIYEITNVTTDTFEITATWVSDDGTGTWHHGSHLLVQRRGTYRLTWSFSASSGGTNQTFEFTVYNKTSQIAGTKLLRKFSTADVGVMSGTGIVSLEKGDQIFFAFRNTTSAGNITISEGALNINKIS